MASPGENKVAVKEQKTDILCRVTDPEVKRKIIGDTFVNVAHRIITEMALNPKMVFLGQVRWRIKKG